MFSSRDDHLFPVPPRSGVAALVAIGTLLLGACGATVGGGTATAMVENLVGQHVTVDAEVSEVVGSHGLLMAGDIGEPLLVIHGGTRRPPVVGTQIQVSGTVRPSFVVTEAQRLAGADLDDATFERFTGWLYIEAHNIDTIVSAQ